MSWALAEGGLMELRGGHEFSWGSAAASYPFLLGSQYLCLLSHYPTPPKRVAAMHVASEASGVVGGARL